MWFATCQDGANMQISIVKTFPALMMAAALGAGLTLDVTDGAQAAADADAAKLLPRIEGAYAGTMGGAEGPASAFQLLVLPGGDFFAIYGENANGRLAVRGYMQGHQAEVAPGSWAGSGREFGIESPSGVQLKATWAPDVGVAGTVVGDDGLVSRFSGTAVPPTTFDYKQPAQLSSIVGTWTMNTPYDQRATLAISQDSVLTGSVDGCTFSGKATPLPSRNVFDVAMTFGGEPCVLVGQTARGIALAHHLPDGRQQLMVMVQDDSRSEGGLLVGQR